MASALEMRKQARRRQQEEAMEISEARYNKFADGSRARPSDKKVDAEYEDAIRRAFPEEDKSMNCPNCNSDRIIDNRHNEHICQDCGECFYVSDFDEITEALRYA